MTRHFSRSNGRVELTICKANRHKKPHTCMVIGSVTSEPIRLTRGSIFHLWRASPLWICTCSLHGQGRGLMIPVSGLLNCDR
ncbi:High affinity iron permease ftrA [Fusarium oxysporum f. sp. albedinis]|nr:High affinity iron permease ftrA [Fusarium oxysporum f. sp. albedinis]